MTTHTAPPLLYPQLRMLAEAALGVPNFESATFTFDPTNTNGPLLVPAGTDTLPGVTVPVWNETKFTDPRHVVLEVRTDGDQYPTLNAVDYHADAVFWSAAAVQKFVLPYYASCMGYGAAASLTALEQAWHGEVAGRRVFALMHVPAARHLTGAETPVEPLWVVFLEGDQVRALPLADFAGLNPAPLPPQPLPAPVPYTAPTLEQIPPPYPDYTALRSIAEWAAALDERPMYFTYDPHERQFGLPTSDAHTGGGRIVVPAFNPLGRKDRLKPRRVTFGSADVGPFCDAAFWSTGAIEQFLLPYYASIDGFAGLADLQALREAWTENRVFVGGNLLEHGREVHVLGPEEPGTVVVGILHIWPSMLMTDEAPSHTASSHTAVRREITALHVPHEAAHRWGVRERPERAAGAA